MAIPLSSPLFDEINNVEEFISRSTYNYLTGDEKSVSEVKMIINNVQNSFPDASIIAFKNGKKIKLKKALKATSK
jgi:phospholipid/cholesterol/gamma-HCH transport system substrate-binding protein